MMAVTSIQLSTETRDLLKSVARGTTYDEMIAELLTVYDAYIEEQLRKIEEDWDKSRPLEDVVDEIERSLAPRSGEKA